MTRNDKKALRRAILRRRRGVSMTRRACRDAAIFRRLLRWLAALPKERPIFCYVGADFEIATRSFIAAALDAGYTVCVPLCGEFGQMEARRITSLSDLRPGAFGLPEPGADTAVVEPEALGAVIVPGLAFDRAGYRLGRGGGFYDRYLARLSPDAVTVGLCYDDFLSDVPRDGHDRPVGMIITEKEEILCS